MKLSDIISFKAIVPQLAATDRNGVIEELVNSLHKAKKLGKADPAALAKAVIKRENEASTGIGKGVAVPHVKHADVSKLVAVVGCSSSGIDFASLDKQPVYTVFLLISPQENPDKHLQAMEIIFKNLQKDDFRRFLRQAQTPEDIIEAIKDADGEASEYAVQACGRCVAVIRSVRCPNRHTKLKWKSAIRRDCTCGLPCSSWTGPTDSVRPSPSAIRTRPWTAKALCR